MSTRDSRICIAATLPGGPAGHAPSPQTMMLRHAQLAQDLSWHVRGLRDARAGNGDVAATVAHLRSFVRVVLAPYVDDEQHAIEADPARYAPDQRALGWAMFTRRHQEQEHVALAVASAHVSAARTPIAVLRAAESLQKLFDGHIRREDARFLQATERLDAGPVPPQAALRLQAELARYLTTEVAEQHRQIKRSMVAAKQAAELDRVTWVEACDVAIAAISAHASLVCLHLYPLADELLGYNPTTQRLVDQLRDVERAMLHIQGILRGDARRNLRDFAPLWTRVEGLLRDHIPQEELLVRAIVADASPGQVVTLLGNIRKGARPAVTRPHPRGFRTGQLARLTKRLTAWLDCIRDGVDSRCT